MRTHLRLAAQSVSLGCGLSLWYGAWAVWQDRTVTPALAVALAPLVLVGVLALYVARPLED